MIWLLLAYVLWTLDEFTLMWLVLAYWILFSGGDDD